MGAISNLDFAAHCDGTALFRIGDLPVLTNPDIELGILNPIVESNNPREAFEEIMSERFENPTPSALFSVMLEAYENGTEFSLPSLGMALAKKNPDAFQAWINFRDRQTWKPFQDPEEKQTGFYFRQVGKLLSADVTDIPWLIKNVIQDSALVCIFGPSATLKTFLGVSLVCCIATGTAWYGHEVKKKGPVFYLAGEGLHGLPKRFLAWQVATGIKLDDAPIFVSSMAAQLLDTSSAEAVGQQIDQMAATHGAPVAVIIDTLARNLGSGDENRSQDIGDFLANLDRYIGSDVTKILIHHTGHTNKDRARGSYSLLAAVDAEFRTEKLCDGSIRLDNTKSKDFEQWPEPMTFEPQTVIVGESDEDGPITSLYLKYTGTQKEVKNLGYKMEKALDLLVEMERQCSPASVTVKSWRSQCVQEGIYTREKTYNAFDSMEKQGLISKDRKHVVIKNYEKKQNVTSVTEV